ncbi:MAG: hypothetical protein ACKN9T_09450 [Candidatus Methylumidiphilus sp.]
MANYKIEIPEKTYEELKKFAHRRNITIDEASARAFGLVALANTVSQEENTTLGIIKRKEGEKPDVVGEITGV